jgi:hypothetical protein
MGRARPLTVLLAVGGLVIAIGCVRAGHAAERPPVYSVRMLRAALAQAPEPWAGRTLLVRGVVKGCPYLRPGPCASWPPALTDPAEAASPPDAELLPLAWGSAPPWVAFLRRLPLLSAVVPAAQAPRWGALAVYRVQVRALRCGAAQSPCYEALLLDAKASSQW